MILLTKIKAKVFKTTLGLYLSTDTLNFTERIMHF